MADNTYVPTGAHLDVSLTAEEKKLVDVYKKQWEKASAKGDTAGMATAHEAAELVRANSSNPYSGGRDGSEFMPLAMPPDSGNSNGISSNGGAPSGYAAAALPPAQSYEDYIRAIYAAQEELALEQLKSQYEQNVLELDSRASKIPAGYTAARNSAGGDSEIAKSAFNERAAAYGLSSGAGSQAALSMNSALLGSFASISKAEADALGEVELLRAELQAAYSSSISKAIAENNLERASALYRELVRLDDANYARALAQASENYREYQSAKA